MISLACIKMPAWRPRAARLETRTKESDAHASGEGNNLILNRVVKARKCFLRETFQGRKEWFRTILALSADLDFLEGFEQERVRWDPKDRELRMARTRPGETLVEVRSGTDVQIVRRSCP